MNSSLNDLAFNIMAPKTLIFLYVALPSEAKPLIKHFNLKKETQFQAFAIFRKDSICLTVSGVGKSSMAAAVAYSQALFGTASHAIFINTGIAGHKTHLLGKQYCIEKIIDSDTGKNFYPQLVANFPCATETLITVSQATLNYPENTLYDMEGSAFYETATRFTSSELIQSLKVISDNENSTTENIDAKYASELMSNSIGILEKLILELTRLASLINPYETALYQQIISKWHFSSSHQLILKDKLNKWLVISNNEVLPRNTTDCKSAKEFLHKLQNLVDKYNYQL